MHLRSRLPTVFGYLRSNRPFLRLLFGRLVTNAGDSLYYIAAMWLVYDLTGSPLYTGVAGFLVRAPAALSFLTGPLVDRWSLRRVLVGSQLINGALVLAIPVAAWSGHLSVWVILAVLPLVTFVNQFVYPAQNAALPQMVAEDNLAHANSLLSAAYKGANMVFNAASGVLIALIGAVTLFVVDSATFGLAVVLFAGIAVAGVPAEEDADAETDEADAVETEGDSESAGAVEAEGAEGDVDGATETDDADTDEATADDSDDDGYLTRLREGFAYVRGSLLVVLLVGVVATNFTSGAMHGVLPAFADTVGGPGSFGLLMAAYAGGAFVGTVVAARFDDVPLGRFVIVSMTGAGLLFAGALTLAWFPATLALFFLTFVPVGAFNVLFWTALQSAVDDDLLGRVSSLLSSAATAALPLGSAVGGAVANVAGTRFVMYWLAVGTGGFGLYVAARPGLRKLPRAADVDASMLEVGNHGDGGTAGDDGPAPTPAASD